MSFGVALYLTSADRTAGTNAISSGDWSKPLDLGSLSIPASGSTTSTPVEVYGKNIGTTTISTISVQASATNNQGGHADVSPYIAIAPDNAGAAGAFGAAGAATQVNAAQIAPGGTFQFWVEAQVPSTAQPAGTAANYGQFQLVQSVTDLG